MRRPGPRAPGESRSPARVTARAGVAARADDTRRDQQIRRAGGLGRAANSASSPTPHPPSPLVHRLRASCRPLGSGRTTPTPMSARPCSPAKRPPRTRCSPPVRPGPGRRHLEHFRRQRADRPDHAPGAGVGARACWRQGCSAWADGARCAKRHAAARGTLRAGPASSIICVSGQSRPRPFPGVCMRLQAQAEGLNRRLQAPVNAGGLELKLQAADSRPEIVMPASCGGLAALRLRRCQPSP